MPSGEDNPLAGVISRAVNCAQLHGAAFIKIVWDAERDEFRFNIITPEFVRVTYEEQDDAKR